MKIIFKWKYIRLGQKRQREKQVQKAPTHTKGEKMKTGADRWKAHY